MKGKKVDLIVHNAQIHTMDDNNQVHEAMAIKDGKIVEVGPERQILNKYRCDEEIDAQGKDVYPGLTDAHGHLISYAKQKLSADLVGTQSFDELLVRCDKYRSHSNKKFIIGRGWDQSLWNEKELPTNEKLSETFSKIPVCLYRIDGHAVLVNDFLLKKAGITAETKIDGGEIVLKNGKPTGLLIDNAINLIQKYIPEFSHKEISETILEIQNELIQYGITGVHEAGIENDEIAIFKKLIERNKLKINVYAMLMPTKKNKEFASKHGKYRFKNLSIRSFKVFADGALGSRGALLKKPYTDAHDSHGLLLTSVEEMREIANFCLRNKYQMNTHGIGDSANALILDIYKNAYEINPDHRFRVEHAQVIDPKDFEKFAAYAVFPSVQPTHAVSDQRWVEARLGKDRLKGAYAYKSLLFQYGMLAIGTDFPVEQTNPFLTIHAAVERKNAENQPMDGFLKSEALSIDEVMKGMTKWAAFASFDENRFGTLTKGKQATFVIFENKIESNPIFQQNFSWKTYIRGKLVYASDEL
jgi:hypothetical protein